MEFIIFSICFLAFIVLGIKGNIDKFKRNKIESDERVANGFNRWLHGRREAYDNGLDYDEKNKLASKIKRYNDEKEYAKARIEREQKHKIQTAENDKKIIAARIEEEFKRNPINHFLFEITQSNGQCCGVYMINSQATKQYYIGSSRNIYNRSKQHLYDLNRNVHANYKLQKLYDDYGASNLQFYALNLIDRESERFDRMTNYKPWSELSDTQQTKILFNSEQVEINRFFPVLNIHKDVYEYRKKYGNSFVV